jgi:multidrug efflux pump subunit AcrA (membrane-fusion protein)
MKFKNFSANTLQILMALVFSANIFSCSNKEKTEESPEKYIVINPIQADSSFNQEYVAEIQSIQNVELRARAKGFLERIYIDEGKPVSKGQLLFTLNSSEYRQELAKAKAQLASAEAELQQALANEKIADTEIQQSSIEVENISLLVEKKIISSTEAKLAKAKLSAANAKKEESKAMINAIKAKIQEANATISLANINLGFTEIRAPFSGVINRIPNKVGSLVDEGTLLTTISNNNEMFAYFNVSETDYLNHITENNNNKKVNLKLANGAAFPHTGVIETIDGEIDQSTGNLSFRAKFPNPDKLLKHGASGKVLVKTELKNAMLIPQKSTFEIQGNIYVFVVSADSMVQQRQITPTARLSQLYVIQPTLATNDKIIYEGIQRVKDGDKVHTETISFSQIKNTKN